MNRIICLMLAAVLCLCLAGCSVSEEEINDLLRTMPHSFSINNKENVKLANRCIQEDSFPALLEEYMEQLSVSDEYDDAIRILEHLGGTGL